MDMVEVEPDGFFSYSLGCDSSQNAVFSEGYPKQETLLCDTPSLEENSYHPLKRLSQKWMKPLCLNLEGWKKFSEGKHKEALGLFQQAAAADETNSNALRHCRVVYRKLKRLEEVEEMSRQIEALCTGELAQVSKARSIAEVAVAGRVQSMSNSTSSQMLQRAITIAENRTISGEETAITTAAGCSMNCESKKAVQITQSSISGREIAFWKLALIHTINEPSLIENASIKNDTDVFNVTRQRYKLYTELACGDFAEMTAQALTQIGLLLQRPASIEVKEWLERIIQEEQVLGGSLKPGEYFQAAYELDPSSPCICTDYTFYLTRNNDLPKAEAMMKNIFSNLGSTECYTEAHAVRAELLLKLYQRQKQKKEYLKQAITDLRIALKLRLSRLMFGQLATCYHLLLMHDRPIFIEQDAMERTLAYFEKAIELLGCHSNTQLHRFHSECLADFGYIRRAVESSKRVVENDDQHFTYMYIRYGTSSFMNHLMKRLLKLYEEEEGPGFILSEITYWMQLVCDKYKHLEEDAVRRTVKDLWFRNESAAVRLYHNLHHMGRDDIATLFLKYIYSFRPGQPRRSRQYIAPPMIAFPHNQLGKDFDVLVLHSVTDRPWVYYSLLTKLEMVHELKCCLVGRDILKDGHDDLDMEDEVDIDEATCRVDAGIQIPTVMGRNLVLIMKPIEYPSASIHDTHERHVNSKSNNIDEALQSSIENSVCVMLVVTENALNNSIWFRDYKPSALLEQLMASHHDILALCLDKKSCSDELFPSCKSIKKFDGSVLVPWEALVEHIKRLCGDTEEDLCKFDVVADMHEDILINEDED